MNRRAAAVEALQLRLGHIFADTALLERALTHSSASGGAVRIADNERLEFLGDRVLGLTIAQALMERNGEASAGDLAKRFAWLVSREACARVARTVNLGAALRLAGGESRAGARDHESIIADACEAVIAALYLELGFERATELVLRLWAPLLDEPVDLAAANPKSALQEWAAANGYAPPVYRLISRSGPDHRPSFLVEVQIETEPPVQGSGGTLQNAEKAAALCLLQGCRSPS